MLLYARITVGPFEVMPVPEQFSVFLYRQDNAAAYRNYLPKILPATRDGSCVQEPTLTGGVARLMVIDQIAGRCDGVDISAAIGKNILESVPLGTDGLWTGPGRAAVGISRVAVPDEFAII